MDWQLIIFDCDGVLVDSEPIANRVMAEVLTENGLPMTTETCFEHFLGRTMSDCVRVLATRFGHTAAANFADDVRQRTLAALREEIEPVAGIVEAGETPEEVACREAVEEAGCEVTDLEPIGTVLSTPGGCSEVLHLYCGRVDSASIGGIHGLTQEHEDIRAFTLPMDTALERLAKGEYNNASTVMALQWLALNRERLKKKWS